MRSNKTRQVDYEIGDMVAIPLKRGGFGVALIAARWEERKKGSSIVLCYGMDKLFRDLDEAKKTKSLVPTDCVCVQLCGDKCVTTGRWKCIGRVEDATSTTWPCPPRRVNDNAVLLDVSTWTVAELRIEDYVPRSKIRFLRKDQPGLGMADYLEYGLDDAVREREGIDFFPVSKSAVEFWMELYKRAHESNLFV